MSICPRFVALLAAPGTPLDRLLLLYVFKCRRGSADGACSSWATAPPGNPGNLSDVRGRSVD
ncbi:hypothetical protein PsorP6_005439 [Peronosclerospora sorghi]|uniref:Uncharacterized protein n=1 Tax=Peronosclerospora sorghi TaxID=230839 RepID=A0ACC0W6A2_9STRA|nr:hypothetical protein PsorP6_005439 [Peronosclerospora sorghi]